MGCPCLLVWSEATSDDDVRVNVLIYICTHTHIYIVYFSNTEKYRNVRPKTPRKTKKKLIPQATRSWCWQQFGKRGWRLNMQVKS